MTKDEALRLALEALENITSVSICEATHHPKKDRHLLYEECPNEVRHLKAINAIKTALEAKDEPVAWRDAAIRLGEELSSVGPDGYYDMDAKEWLDWAMEQNPRGKHSLPQRTWVGLTEKDICEAAVKSQEGISPRDDTLRFAIAIEAKLKEKNT